MTRTIQMCVEFTGTDDQVVELDFDNWMTIREKAYGNKPAKYISMSFEDFEKIVAEYENFKKLNAQGEYE